MRQSKEKTTLKANPLHLYYITPIDLKFNFKAKKWYLN